MSTSTALMACAAFAFFAGFWTHDAIIKFASGAPYAFAYVIVALLFALAAALAIRRVAKQVAQQIK